MVVPQLAISSVCWSLMAEVGDFPSAMDDGCLQEGVGSERSGGGAPSTRSSERSFPEVV